MANEDPFHAATHETIEKRLSKVEEFFPKISSEIADLKARVYLSGTIAGSVVGVIIALVK